MSTTSAENGARAIAEDLALFCWVVTRAAVVDFVAGKTARRSRTSVRAHDLDCAWWAAPSVAFRLAWMRRDESTTCGFEQGEVRVGMGSEQNVCAANVC